MRSAVLCVAASVLFGASVVLAEMCGNISCDEAANILQQHGYPVPSTIVLPTNATGLPCSNPRLPTAAEVAAGARAGIMGCPSDFQTIGPDAGAGKQYL